MRVNATRFKNNLGQYLESSIREPVIVEKSGRDCAVLISSETYERLAYYEDLYWGRLAAQAESEGYLGVEETAKRLRESARKAGIEVENDKKEQTTGHHSGSL